MTRIPYLTTGFLLTATVLSGCAANRPPQFSYDDDVPPMPAVRTAVT